jgi:O-antigen biosynthesis protein WbqP
MKRAMDIFLTAIMLSLFSIPMALVAIAVKITAPGPVLYWSKRRGKDNLVFWMPKFRTMRVDTPVVATRHLNDPDYWITPIGNLLRNTSLDELPQLWNILKGDMSFVGPRPILLCEDDLIDLRTSRGVHTLKVGLTGWAQINGREELSVPDKVEFDVFYLENQTLWLDVKIMLTTIGKVVSREGTVAPQQPASPPLVEEIPSRRKAA